LGGLGKGAKNKLITGGKQVQVLDCIHVSGSGPMHSLATSSSLLRSADTHRAIREAALTREGNGRLDQGSQRAEGIKVPVRVGVHLEAISDMSRHFFRVKSTQSSHIQDSSLQPDFGLRVGYKLAHLP